MESLPVSLSRNKETGIVKHVTVKIQVFLLHKFDHLQPVLKAALVSGVMRRQAWLAFRLSAGNRFENRGILHVNLGGSRHYLGNTDAKD
jgi:hypothetical protein